MTEKAELFRDMAEAIKTLSTAMPDQIYVWDDGDRIRWADDEPEGVVWEFVDLGDLVRRASKFT